MTEIDIPELPEGDTWHVEPEKNAWASGKVFVYWRHGKTNGGYFHVASETTHGSDTEVFKRVYKEGLKRLKADRKEEKNRRRTRDSISVLQEAVRKHNDKR